ncbi:MAG: hypothetical protein ACRDH2_04455 [Anaerolineales bacterium]
MTLSHHLTTLEASGLIRLAQIEPELEYLFRHALVQEAAYSSLVKSDRKLLHRTVGEALERTYPGQLDSRELAPLLGQHFSLAGDDARALHYFTLAGDAAARVYANAEAIMHYSRAIEMAQNLAPGFAAMAHGLQDLYLRRGRMLELNGQFDEALASYAEMEALAGARADRAMQLAALMARATIHSTPTARFDVTQGELLSQQAMALARELGDRAAEAKILWNLVLLNNFSGRYEDALNYGEQSLKLARELGLREQLAYTLNDLNPGYATTGQPHRAVEALEEAQILWRELGNQPMLADSLSSLSLFHYFGGKLEQALTLAKEAHQISRAIGNLWGQSYSLWHIGLIGAERGDMAQAVEALSESERLGEQAGFAIAEVAVRAQLSLIYGTLGLVASGLELAHLALARSEMLISWRYFPLASLIFLNILNGDLPTAEAALIQCETGLRDPFARNYLVLAEVDLRLAQQKYAETIKLTDELDTSLRQSGMRVFLPSALDYKGRALLALDRLDEAEAALTEARAEAEAIGSRRSLWPVLIGLHQIKLRRGHLAEAERLRTQAREVIRFIADHCPPDLRASFLNLPEVQVVMEAA